MAFCCQKLNSISIGQNFNSKYSDFRKSFILFSSVLISEASSPVAKKMLKNDTVFKGNFAYKFFNGPSAKIEEK